MNTLPENPLPSRGLTRRNVVRGAAWTVPAVTLVTAAPAFAASSPREISFTPQEAEWTTLEDWSSEEPVLAVHEQPLGMVVEGLIWFETPSTKEKPDLTLTLTFPQSWLAAGAAAAGTDVTGLDAGSAPAPVIALAYGRYQNEWRNNWEASADEGHPHGFHTSTERTFTFSHFGEVTSADGYFDLSFRAWVPGADITILTDPIVASLLLTDPTWTIAGATSGVITIPSPPSDDPSPEPTDD